MIDSVLNVFGENFDVESFLQNHPLPFDAEPYIKGEPDLFGSPNLESGFDALISETATPDQHIKELCAFLQRNEALFLTLKQLGATCVIDIGSAVDLNKQFTQSLHIPVDLLGLCYSLNVSIEFSPYPDQDLQQQIH
ncbi:MAG: hypothetical protein P1P93_00660 [Gammaproteobacteria bacterium]|nr:hypothetical protein [Gammaproteobacteria bacterium]